MGKYWLFLRPSFRCLLTEQNASTYYKPGSVTFRELNRGFVVPQRTKLVVLQENSLFICSWIRIRWPISEVSCLLRLALNTLNISPSFRSISDGLAAHTVAGWNIKEVLWNFLMTNLNRCCVFRGCAPSPCSAHKYYMASGIPCISTNQLPLASYSSYTIKMGLTLHHWQI